MATPLAAPMVTATPADSQITLSWTAIAGATSYKVYQDTKQQRDSYGQHHYGNQCGCYRAHQQPAIQLLGQCGEQQRQLAVCCSNRNACRLGFRNSTCSTQRFCSGCRSKPSTAELDCGNRCNQLQGVSGRQCTDSFRDNNDTVLYGYWVDDRNGVFLYGSLSEQSWRCKCGQHCSNGQRRLRQCPAGLAAQAGDTQVVLTWTASTDTAVTGYKIRWTVDGTTVAIAVNTRATYTAGSLVSGKSYSFTIAAVAGSTESTQSTAVTATPLPPAVAGLAATAGIEQVVLTWTASSNTGVTGYKIRTTGSGDIADVDVSGMTTATATVTGLTAGQSYSFTIAAVAGSTEGGCIFGNHCSNTNPCRADRVKCSCGSGRGGADMDSIHQCRGNGIHN